jgi:acyl-coenzyme A thioesterase PaaI-like protein
VPSGDTVASLPTRASANRLRYTSIELKVNYLRAVHSTSGELSARGRVTEPGRRIAFAEGDICDAAIATATGSCLVMPVELIDASKAATT